MKSWLRCRQRCYSFFLQFISAPNSMLERYSHWRNTAKIHRCFLMQISCTFCMSSIPIKPLETWLFLQLNKDDIFMCINYILSNTSLSRILLNRWIFFRYSQFTFLFVKFLLWKWCSTFLNRNECYFVFNPVDHKSCASQGSRECFLEIYPERWKNLQRIKRQIC